MNVFEGFQDGSPRIIPIPVSFFNELLPLIDNLGELKLALYIFWRLEQMEGAFRYFRRQDFTKDKSFFESLSAPKQSASEVLDKALQCGTERGWLLEAQVALKDVETLYFLNTPRGKAAIQAIQRGEWRPTGDNETPITLTEEPPNIYRLYEEHIGPLTPMLADTLRQAEQEYSPHWIEEAMRIAVENNVRNWRYIAAILKRWKDEGKDERKDRQDTEKARRRYSEWEKSNR
ncbi:MAG: DnaD domain protein [Anaerolineales bacterium]|nr:DnaD domain protein [Anaerolineales bacterium]